MKADEYKNNGKLLEKAENLSEAMKLLAFVQHAVTHAPIELQGDAQDGLGILLDDVQKRLGR
jgi:hypothetical protein